MSVRITAELQTQEYRGDHAAEVTIALGEVAHDATVASLLAVAGLASGRGSRAIEPTDVVVLRVVAQPKPPADDGKELPF